MEEDTENDRDCKPKTPPASETISSNADEETVHSQLSVNARDYSQEDSSAIDAANILHRMSASDITGAVLSAERSDAAGIGESGAGSPVVTNTESNENEVWNRELKAESATGIPNLQRPGRDSTCASRGTQQERVSRLSISRKRRRDGAGPSNTGESAAKKVAK